MIEAQKVQVNKYLSKRVFTEVPRTGNDTKMAIRFEIEKKIGEAIDNYDIYDMYADLANATSEIINILKVSENEAITKSIENNEAINKFLNRQQAIAAIIADVKERKKDLV